MSDPSTLQQEILEANASKQTQYEALQQLQQAKLEALQQVLGNRGDYTYLNLNDLIDPDNKNWADYTYWLGSHNNRIKRQGHIDAGTPVGIFIQKIRDAENIGDVYKQSELWNSYDPLSSRDRARKYFRSIFGGKEPDPVQATAGDAQGVQGVQAGTQGTQGVVTVGGAQGAQAGAQTGGTTTGDAQGVVTVGGTGTQGTQGVQAGGTNTGGTSGVQAGNGVAKGGTASTQGAKTGDTGGIYASAGVSKGGTKTIGYDPYDPNPGNVSLAYAMRNAPEQERRAALIDEWNREHGISYATGKDGLIYRTDPQHPNGYVDPFKNDFSAWKTAWKNGSTGYATGKGMLTSSSNSTYATGEGIKDANGNVLTNPGGDVDYQYALKHPEYGLVIRGRMSEPQKDYLQAVSNNMGYNYNF